MQFTNIAKTLQAARENSGKKPEEIAELLGISIPAYHDLEHLMMNYPRAFRLNRLRNFSTC
jgi:transcriptional regulator with XRE-family HTH domain